MVTQTSVNTGSGKGLLPDGTKLIQCFIIKVELWKNCELKKKKKGWIVVYIWG